MRLQRRSLGRSINPYPMLDQGIQSFMIEESFYISKKSIFTFSSLTVVEEVFGSHGPFHPIYFQPQRKTSYENQKSCFNIEIEGFVRLLKGTSPRRIYLIRKVEDIQFRKFTSASSHSRSIFIQIPRLHQLAKIPAFPLVRLLGGVMCQAEAERMFLANFTGSGLPPFFLSLSQMCDDHDK